VVRGWLARQRRASRFVADRIGTTGTVPTKDEIVAAVLSA